MARAAPALFTRHALATALTSQHHIQHERATAELGYAPRPLAATVADTLQWLEGTGHFTRPLRKLPTP